MQKLNHKLSLCVLGSLVAVSVATSALVIRSQRTSLEKDLRHSGETLAATVAAGCVDAILSLEYPYLETFIRSSTTDSDYVVCVRVWESGEGEEEQLVAEYPPNSTRIVSSKACRVFESPIAIEAEGGSGEALGRVEVALSTKRLMRQITASTWQLLLGAVISFTLLAVVIGLALKKVVIDPVNELEKHAHLIQQGDLETPIKTRTKDELGRLASNMEAMRQGLKESYAHIGRQVEELKELDRMKDEFLANTSHELKTPLNGIIGLVDGLRSGGYGEVPETCLKPLTTVLSCAERLWQMNDSIIEFSRLAQSGGLPRDEAQPHAIADHINKALIDLRVEAENKGIHLLITVPKDLQATYRYKELDQVVRILTDNAVKFTEQGLVEVIVRPWENAQVPGFQLAIRDSGMGIPKDMREQIFEPFVQGFRHETRAHGGVGLGLSMVRKLVTAFGGEIILESEDGKGSTFTLLVPEKGPVENVASHFVPWPPLADTASPTAVEATSAPQILETVPDGPPAAVAQNATDGDALALESDRLYHVLATDDDPVNLEVIWQALRHDFRVTRTPDGESCLQVLREKPIDLLLLDIMMPRVSGFDVLEQMKKEGLLERTPVIVLSAKKAPESIVKGLKLGAVDYLGKPFHKQELHTRIRAHLKIKEQKHLLQKEVEAKSNALDAAQHASWVKTQFLANMSHEIRTPITGIMGYLELVLSNEEICAEEQEYLQSAHECTASLLSIVGDILDTAKIESQKTDLELVDCNPRHIIEAVGKLWETNAQSKNLTLDVNIDEGFPEEICCDPHRLRQILDNLMSNAVKFTAEGEIRVSARTLRSEDGEVNEMEITVSDSGIGIEQEKQEEIFLPFTQADVSNSRKYGGTGLGLSISRSLARLLGGDITLESTQDDGATFTIRLPVKVAAAVC
jgi:signal transduction histidine kinase